MDRKTDCTFKISGIRKPYFNSLRNIFMFENPDLVHPSPLKRRKIYMTFKETRPCHLKICMGLETLHSVVNSENDVPYVCNSVYVA